LANKIADVLFEVEPITKAEEVKLAEALRQFAELEKAQRLRLQSVTDGLPSSLWFVIVLGSFLNIVLTWMLVIKNRLLDIFINLIVSLLMGSLLFFVVAMDNPFRGRLSVGSGPYEQVYQSLMR
jgi:hypothetical protein